MRRWYGDGVPLILGIALTAAPAWSQQDKPRTMHYYDSSGRPVTVKLKGVAEANFEDDGGNVYKPTGQKHTMMIADPLGRTGLQYEAFRVTPKVAPAEGREETVWLLEGEPPPQPARAAVSGMVDLVLRDGVIMTGALVGEDPEWYRLDEGRGEPTAVRKAEVLAIRRR